MAPKILYKYRDFNDLKRIEEIFNNSEIYASKYHDLNDPMEGLYYIKNKQDNRTKIDAIFHEKNNFNIGSFSGKNYDKLMWSHYSNGSRGIVIGVSMSQNSYRPRKLIYDGKNNFTLTDDVENQTKEILLHKNDVWNYEDEYRIFTRDQRIKVDIVEVFLGMNISEENKLKVTNYCQKIKNLKIYQQLQDYSFNPEYKY